MSVFASLIFNPPVVVQIVNSFEIYFYIALSMFALIGLLLILFPEQNQAQKHYKEANTEKHPITPSSPKPLVSSHSTRSDKAIVVLNKVNSLYATDDSKHQTNNKKAKSYPLAHIRRIINWSMWDCQPNANSTIH